MLSLTTMVSLLLLLVIELSTATPMPGGWITVDTNDEAVQALGERARTKDFGLSVVNSADELDNLTLVVDEAEYQVRSP